MNLGTMNNLFSTTVENIRKAIQIFLISDNIQYYFFVINLQY